MDTKPKRVKAKMKKPAAKNSMHVRIEADVAREVRTRRVTNGRTVQGEVNTTLRAAYSPSTTPLYDAVVARGEQLKDAEIRTKIPFRLKMTPRP